jgi:hypothetical protein
MNRFAAAMICLGLSALAVAQTPKPPALTDEQVQAAIEQGRKQDVHATFFSPKRLVLIDMEGDNLDITGRDTSIEVYTTEEWIELHSAWAKSQLEPFTIADVPPDMRQPYLVVMTRPSTSHPNDTIRRVMLTDTSKSTMVPPVKQKTGWNPTERVPMTLSVFPLSEVDRVRGGEGGEFFFGIASDYKTKFFKVKKKHFKVLDLK